jgi:hypothetical protein
MPVRLVARGMTAPGIQAAIATHSLHSLPQAPSLVSTPSTVCFFAAVTSQVGIMPLEAAKVPVSTAAAEFWAQQQRNLVGGAPPLLTLWWVVGVRMRFAGVLAGEMDANRLPCVHQHVVVSRLLKLPCF